MIRVVVALIVCVILINLIWTSQNRRELKMVLFQTFHLLGIFDCSIMLGKNWTIFSPNLSVLTQKMQLHFLPEGPPPNFPWKVWIKAGYAE